MIEIKNKVIFLSNKVGGMDKNFQLSSNIKGQLKKSIIKVKKLKIAKKIAVELSGNYKDFEVKVDPADSEHAAKIKAMLKVKK